MKDLVLSTAYWPPISYFVLLLGAAEVWIDEQEHYERQSYRTRCHIRNSQGLQVLSIPVRKTDGHFTSSGRMGLSVCQPWQRDHWRSLVAAYSNSPFFLYYRDSLEALYAEKTEFLGDWNRKLLAFCCQRLELTPSLHYNAAYLDEPLWSDFRGQIHPKKKSILVEPAPYIQTFGADFLPDLSILDLLCNLGPESSSYLHSQASISSSSPCKILR